MHGSPLPSPPPCAPFPSLVQGNVLFGSAIGDISFARKEKKLFSLSYEGTHVLVCEGVCVCVCVYNKLLNVPLVCKAGLKPT